MNSCLGLLLACSVAAYVSPAAAQTSIEPMPIRVVVVTMFEPGADTGDRPGEFQSWVQRFPLPDTITLPQAYRHLRYNAQKGVLGIVTGVGTARAAASIMALGTDARFDLRKAYWLIAGIAGADPNDMSIGSAAWAEWLVDGDLAFEIDPREIPSGWSTGYLPLRKTKPFELPVQTDNEGAVYHLNAALVDWAYNFTRDTPLPDTEGLRELRRHYTAYAEAQRPPFILKGDNLAAATFWHGRRMNDWANEWLKYWTAGQGNFVTAGMEDTGTAQSLTFLAHAGRVDFNRVLVLRTASNYTMQYEGITAAQSLSGEMKGGYSAYLPALDAAYLVGSRVVNEISDNWQKYAEHVPAR